ncbi:MAG: RNA polymerase subunit sigma-54 [Flavobacteriales bacterium]|jgi:putative sigma-54 modulation protein|nr:RNA polymerase subunit sigma-54 [Flavobacteriales bacterium]MBT7489565.1 RNA polymerase subunit sigma-54 [Flavobacteriales bacterium]
MNNRIREAARMLKSDSMKTNVQSIHFKASEKLLTYINEHIARLSRVSDQAESSTVYLRLDNNKSRNNKIVELKVHVPGEDIMVVKESNSFEKSMRMATASARRIMRKSKRKQGKFKLFRRAL